jgi:uncharacterized membrane protein
MLNPDVHITIYISAEVIQYICGTVGFVVAVWGTLKMAKILLRNYNETNTP